MINKIICHHNRKIIIGLIGLATAFLLFTFRLEEVPTGLSVDEASLGYNAILLSKTLHDQNGRFLPFFILTINGRDWKQPIMAYSLAGLFKIIPPTQYSLRLGGVIVVLVSLCLTYLFISKLFNPKYGLIGCLLFISVPIIMIQSHIAHENIMPLPFVLTWLICLLLYEKKKSWKYLFLAGLSLGIGFYSYKSMRLIVPVWSVLTCLYLVTNNFLSQKKINFSLIQSALIFGLSILPFFAITPWLEFKYAGAVFDNKDTNFRYYYDFLFPYLSSFDPAYLFIKGDITIWHSTDRHGMFLLTTLPLFIIGCYQAVRHKGFWLLILLSFFSAPLLFGFVDSVHRFSRLLALIPSFVALSTLGISTFIKVKPKLFSLIILITIGVLSLLNYYDFISYYWYDYPKFSQSSFSLDVHKSYKTLSSLSRHNQITPVIESSIFTSNSESSQFFETAYFDKPLKLWNAEETLPPGSILMTQQEKQPNLKRLNIDSSPYNFLINEDEDIKIDNLR
jgi:hypothetical protein